ncbi:MAG: hypothetical protein IK079_01085, partial [Desulfovibrio sp.]|nr:hypothetical protein [Desulfovibrio sp.]
MFFLEENCRNIGPQGDLRKQFDIIYSVILRCYKTLINQHALDKIRKIFAIFLVWVLFSHGRDEEL